MLLSITYDPIIIEDKTRRQNGYGHCYLHMYIYHIGGIVVSTEFGKSDKRCSQTSLFYGKFFKNENDQTKSCYIQLSNLLSNAKEGIIMESNSANERKIHENACNCSYVHSVYSRMLFRHAVPPPIACDDCLYSSNKKGNAWLMLAAQHVHCHTIFENWCHVFEACHVHKYIHV